MRSRWFGIVLFVWLLCVLPVWAQENGCTRRWVPVNVVDRKGGIVSYLDSSAFQATVHHRAVKILAAVWDQQPRRVMILLDASASMSNPALQALALDGADQLVSQMPPKTQIGLAVFSETITQTTGLTTDRQALRDKLKDLTVRKYPCPKGKCRTALRDAIFESLSYFGTPQEGDVLYVISDGGENGSRRTQRVVDDAIFASGVRVFALGPAWPPEWDRVGLAPRSLRLYGEEDDTWFLDLVEATGGVYVTPTRNNDQTLWRGRRIDDQGTLSPQGLTQQLRQIIGYRNLRIELPDPIYKASTWELKVANTQALKGAEAIYPHILAPCSADSTPATNLK